MPVSVLGGPDAAGLLAPVDSKERHGARDQYAGDKEEAIAHHLRALHLLPVNAFGFGSLFPFFAL